MSLIKALVCLTALSVLLSAFALTLLFWYEAKNSPEARVPAPDWGYLKRGLQFFLNLAEIVCGLLLLPFGPLVRAFFQRPGATERKDLPMLVFIHGLYHNASTWLYMAWFLRKKGFRMRFFTYGRFTPLPAISEDFGNFMRRPDFQGARPLIVAHSMGGLIARACLADRAFEEGVAGVVTLGTPHAGSKLAVLAVGKWNQARFLESGSEFLRSLQDAPAPAIPCVSLAGTADEMVLPASSLVPPPGWTLKLVPNAAHLSMLFCPSTCAALLDELERINLRC
ncbi:MAG: alpha/beta fold hydrolase [Desulfovibrio sp.]|jgi:pimeloyl-ACP methyl ester carboxylesterase|nr:alpha/beta fold hydrolase [Desulfovibrio sp.]